MTTADAQHARPGGITRAWRGFRRWRRSRPFWGGLFTVLAGVEIFGTTQATLAGLTLKMGPTGFLAWLIPTILVVCGLLMWLTPQQRIFYSVIAAVTAVYSLIGVNFGGFFIGMLLGITGAALGFAWVPGRPAPTTEEPGPAVDDEPREGEEAEDEPALIDELLPRQREEETDGPLTDTLPPPRNPLRESTPAEPEAGADRTHVLPAVDPSGPPPGSGHRDPKLYGILLVLATVSTVGLIALHGGQPAVAAPAACPTASSPAPSPTASASASPSPSAAAVNKDSDGNLLTNIIDGITGLFTGGDAGTAPTPASTDDPAAAAEPLPAVTTTGPSPSESTTSAAPTPSSSTSARPTAPTKPDAEPCASPAPTKPKPVEVGKPLPRIAAEPGQPRVAAKPAKLTGSKVTMTGLHFDGIVDLPTADGTLKCLKFTMDKGVTDDFVLQADGPAGKTMRKVTDQLTVQGDVAFYTTRFSARFLGIPITLTPDLPFPDGLPITSPVPLTFTDPVIDLAFVDSNVLTAKPTLKLDLV
ncbi:DUF6114 domain-containing protein [Micromonospora sp. DR5-3]|uniref:DUF6114 domain-containing protein n=1 Tax=unclassified Micromonospora TaxID=2617518 RepID=UPI0011D3F9D8|nr:MULTISPECIES: DUF6114 domain-containing protein [unclassified Micromonospora]MCW3813220.1 DUF6114 domain-containing protein [Micromonospora sp. DR5-3]TYC25807.1 hypothetical protein FXF52_00025 [Micromonospora sp. MP36]